MSEGLRPRPNVYLNEFRSPQFRRWLRLVRISCCLSLLLYCQTKRPKPPGLYGESVLPGRALCAGLLNVVAAIGFSALCRFGVSLHAGQGSMLAQRGL